MNDDLIPTTFPQETPETIRSRILSRMNLGISPTDPGYVGVSPGDPLSDFAGMLALEADEIYDRIFEVLVAASPMTATGQFLVAWAVVVDINRNRAAKAEGVARFEGPNGSVINAGTPVSTESPSETTPPVEFVTTEPGVIASGFAEVPIRASEAGSAGNVAASSITMIGAPGLEMMTVTNPARITGGADEESDERLRVRVNRKLRGTGGSGNQDAYVDEALDEPGVGYVTVVPNDGGVGNVRLIVTDINNDPISDALIERLQLKFDPPTVGQGAGTAPVGAKVVIATPAPTTVAVAAGLSMLPGYSITGAGGTIAVNDAVKAAISSYVDQLAPGEDVLRHRVVAAILSVEGIYNVNEPTISGAAADLAIDNAHVAVMGAVTLS